jgi:hypothetical protein
VIPVNKAWYFQSLASCGEMPQPAELLIIAAVRFTALKRVRSMVCDRTETDFR